MFFKIYYLSMAEQRRVEPEAKISPWLPDIVISAIKAEAKNEDTTVFVRPQQCLVDKNGQTSKIDSAASNPDDVRNRIPPTKLWQNWGEPVNHFYFWQKRRELDLQRDNSLAEKCTRFERRFDGVL